MDAQHTNHVTYKLAYHLVWCPKYRKKILVGKLALFIEQEIRRLCEANTWAVGALKVQEDHVQRVPQVKKYLWGGAFWSRSSYVGSVGDMSVDTVLTYI
jgi:putative transposase